MPSPALLAVQDNDTHDSRSANGVEPSNHCGPSTQPTQMKKSENEVQQKVQTWFHNEEPCDVWGDEHMCDVWQSHGVTMLSSGVSRQVRGHTNAFA
jgi:hypothetical protein